MEIDKLVAAGLVVKSGDNVKILSARDRRRERPLNAQQQSNCSWKVIGRRSGSQRGFSEGSPPGRFFQDGHGWMPALALAYLEAGGGAAGSGQPVPWREGRAGKMVPQSPV